MIATEKSNHLYIIRGASGSGKTTLATKMLYAGLVSSYFEADMWMKNTDGEYEYDHGKLAEVHKKCLSSVISALNTGDVAVANTFTRIWEMQPYLDIGCPVTVIRCEGAFQNIHGVPQEKVAQMQNRFEEYRGKS